MSVSRRGVLTTAADGGRSPLPDPHTLREAADFAVDRIRTVAPRVTAFPVGTKFEKWVYSQNGDWVGGFWPGTLWMAWLHTGDDAFPRSSPRTAAHPSHATRRRLLPGPARGPARPPRRPHRCPLERGPTGRLRAPPGPGRHHRPRP
ncbi:hypothetical protein ACF1HJ_42455 [Streptomyces sp. NPDC013978]|uniref:hypothetical protein n=1 Tax=Streptomyces sp. NPDC013978 TaxID=3364869 RepID=UPI0036F5534E